MATKQGLEIVQGTPGARYSLTGALGADSQVPRDTVLKADFAR